MIYFDNNATTEMAGAAVAAMLPFLAEHYGNPSSAYSFARTSRKAVEQAREKVAGLLGADHPDEVVFTSGGTESDNWAIRGAIAAANGKRKIVTTTVAHEAVRKLCDSLEKDGFEVLRLDVDREGMIDLDRLAEAVDDRTAVVSMMLANNETGVVFPVEEAAKMIRSRSGALFHVDAVNAAGKVPIRAGTSGIDLISVSAHKFHGPKGIGALYIRNGVELSQQSIGGGQEDGRRAGTEAVHQIVAMGAAAGLVSDLSDMERVQELRDRLERGILETIADTSVNGAGSPRIPNTSNISFAGANGEGILARLNDIGICVSTGSACNEGAHTVSPVLKAMDIPFDLATSSVRFSLGRMNTEEEVDKVLEALPGIISDLRSAYSAGA
ncbi:MAG: aminotransferase class V-fold PLP-dependent enzyme [Acidobacteriota bacterium]|nr:MAG: aminotransferase class V-fold PLP-dependent enzyme [Acidobacteriota bacterium]